MSGEDLDRDTVERASSLVATLTFLTVGALLGALGGLWVAVVFGGIVLVLVVLLVVAEVAE